jgi:DNA-directed RNA polymerase specialized sigma24 family protein
MEGVTRRTEADMPPQHDFDAVLVRVERALIARFGAEIGAEVAADTREWAWANRDVLTDAANPGGWLFRVGQSRARVHTRWFGQRAPIELLPEGVIGEPNADLIDLFRCLGKLNDAQRVAVVLVHAHGERYDDVAHVLGVSTAAVTNHVHRGLKRLRELMENER